MRAILTSALITVVLSGCSYQGGESWRRSVCDPIVDTVERERCLDDATRSENEYRRDVEAAGEP